VVEWLHIVTKGEVEILEGSVGIGTRISGEGDPFGELSFMTSQPSPETVRAHTPIEVASISKAELAEVLKRHPRMSDYLSSLLSRHSKTIQTRATTLSHADFKGALDVTPFADLIQLLGSTRKTGVLGFRTRTARARSTWRTARPFTPGRRTSRGRTRSSPSRAGGRPSSRSGRSSARSPRLFRRRP
jgi:CRP-like cAMP-binding protein